MVQLRRTEPYYVEQVAARIWAIASADMWPGITPLNVRSLSVSEWEALAVTCDQRLEDRRQAAAEAASRRGR